MGNTVSHIDIFLGCFRFFLILLLKHFYAIIYLRLDIAATFHQTDKALGTLKEWRDIEGHKIFASKLRFQIRLDDFR